MGDILKISLESARVNAKLTQKDVSIALNRNPKTIVSWEKGYSKPKIADAIALSSLYGIPLENISF